eukprot:Platyproteum_vivax@DN6338_c0_g1_i1.p1
MAFCNNCTPLVGAHATSFLKINESETHSATLVIFDWDDTLMPTSWITSKPTSDLTSEEVETVDKLCTKALNALSAACRMGTVVIVTNSHPQWIELSCSLFMPALWTLVRNIPCVSAKQLFGKEGTPYEWKSQAFKEVVAQFNVKTGCRLTNIISVGDSHQERAALLDLHKETEEQVQYYAKEKRPFCGSKSLTKSLKLLEKPNCFQLAYELDLVAAMLPEVVSSQSPLDLSINAPPPQS